MDSKACAWAAGFFDAEGCVSISKSGSANLALAVTHCWSRDWFNIVLGMGNSHMYDRADYKTIHTWNISKRKYVRRGIEKILPYSVTKAQELASLYDHLQRLEEKRLWASERFQWEWYRIQLQLLKKERKLGRIIDPGEKTQIYGLNKPERIAWAAGLFDGDGCLLLEERLVPRVTVQMCDEMTISNLAALWPNGTVGMYRPKKANWNVAFSWSLRKERALEFLRQIRPYMVTKAVEADTLLSAGSLEQIGAWKLNQVKEELQRLKREVA